MRSQDFARARRLSRIHSCSNLEVCEADQSDKEMVPLRLRHVRRSLPYIYDSNVKPLFAEECCSAAALYQVYAVLCKT